MAPGLYLVEPRRVCPHTGVLGRGEGHDRRLAHARNTFRGYLRKRAALTYLGGVCASCGLDGHMAQMHVDHLDPATKRTVASSPGKTFFSISGGGGGRRLTPADLAELDTCQLLCANCHALKGAGLTNEYLEYYSTEQAELVGGREVYAGARSDQSNASPLGSEVRG